MSNPYLPMLFDKNLPEIINGQKKFLHFQQPDWDELKRKLIFLLPELGFVKIPTDASFQLFFHIVKIGYGQLSIAEINAAFTLALAGSLELKDTQHYQAFIPYASKVLIAYKKYRNDNLKMYYDRKKQDEVRRVLLEKPAVSKEEFQKNWCAVLEKTILSEKKIPDFFFNWSDVFEHLEETGEIKDTIEEKNLFKENEIFEIKGEFLSRSPKQFFQTHTDLKAILKDDGLLKTELQKRRAYKYFKAKFNL